MTVSVVIPWQAGCPHREEALAWVRHRWAVTGYEVAIGAISGGWCKASAVAAGLGGVTGDVLVVADADCWSDGVHDAIAAVRGGAPWAMPHRRVHRLTRGATRDVLAGADPHARMGLTQRPYVGWPGGGMVVVPRAMYEEVPLDPRFVGWSGEDESWAHALTCLAGPPWRGRSPLWHLWHPPQERMSRRWGSEAARDLAGRYKQASGDPAAMRALLDETRIPA